MNLDIQRDKKKTSIKNYFNIENVNITLNTFNKLLLFKLIYILYYYLIVYEYYKSVLN